MFYRTLQYVMSSDLKLSDKSFHLLCLSFPISKMGAMTAHSFYKNCMQWFKGSSEPRAQGTQLLFQLMLLSVGLLDVTGWEWRYRMGGWVAYYLI